MAAREWVELPLETPPELWARLAWSSDLWVFAYGSLMWDPGFPYCEAVPAVRHGHHRSFCVYSRSHRGTADRPGLVLGLDRGGSCKGVAYRVPAIDVPEALAYLWDREMHSLVYRLEELDVELPTGPDRALAFVVDPAHGDYAGGLAVEAMARLIHEGRGANGFASDYLAAAMHELTRLGVVDPSLKRLERAVRNLGEASQRAA